MSDSPVLALVKDLIAEPSVTPDDKQCQQILMRHLAPIGFTAETFTEGGVTNLWARRGTSGPLLVFAAARRT